MPQKLILTIDDVNPAKISARALQDFCKEFPVKLSAFLSCFYEGTSIESDPLWCEVLRQLILHRRVQVCIHGFKHELDYDHATFDECVSRLAQAERLLAHLSIPFVKVFRPPYWNLSKPLVQALQTLSYTHCFVHPKHRSVIDFFTGTGLSPVFYTWNAAEAQYRETPEIVLHGHCHPVCSNGLIDVVAPLLRKLLQVKTLDPAFAADAAPNLPAFDVPLVTFPTAVHFFYPDGSQSFPLSSQMPSALPDQQPPPSCPKWKGQGKAQVTFVIASIGRPSLAKTIESLYKQTNSDWLALVVFDRPLEPRYYDGRIRYLQTPFSSTGYNGKPRNFAMNFVGTEWTAFVDDDDTLTPDYVERLLREGADADVVHFRMKYRHGLIFPPPELGHGFHPLPTNKERPTITLSRIGTSFAYRTKFFPRFRHREQDCCSDFYLLSDFAEGSLRIYFSEAVTYLVDPTP